MSTTQAPALSAPSPDRSVRLMVLGGFQVVLGVLCGLMAVMMGSLVLGGRMPQAPQGPQFSPRMMIPSLGIYVLIAVGFIWMGIGMIRIRRWAWALTLVMSWMGLICGLFASVIMPIFMTKTWGSLAEQNQMTTEMVRVMWTTTILVLIGLYVFLPGIFVVLCQPKSVRDTVYRRDPTPRWTDRCPMPVLALVIMHAAGALSTPSLAIYNWVVPVFGFFLSGPAGAAVICLLAVLLACLAWGTYRLKMLAWWGTVVLGIVYITNSVLFLRRGDLLTMYEKMGFPAETIDMIKKTGVLEMLTSYGVWINVAFGAVWFGYLLYLRRYFVRKSEIASVPL
jgi:hypothetical protein